MSSIIFLSYIPSFVSMEINPHLVLGLLKLKQIPVIDILYFSNGEVIRDPSLCEVFSFVLFLLSVLMVGGRSRTLFLYCIKLNCSNKVNFVMYLLSGSGIYSCFFIKTSAYCCNF